MRVGTPGVQLLIEALRRADVEDRYDLIRILGRLGPAASDAVPALRRELTGPWPALAAGALAKITANATWGIPTLVDALEESGEDPLVFDALARLGPLAQLRVFVGRVP